MWNLVFNLESIMKANAEMRKVVGGIAAVFLLAIITMVSGCNVGGGEISVIKTRNFKVLTAQVNPIGFNLLGKNTSELFATVQNKNALDNLRDIKAEDTTISMRSIKAKERIVRGGMLNKVLKGPEEVSHVMTADVSTGVLDWIYGKAKEE